MTLPTLTVVVPNYNHGHLLRECLDSLVNQSVKPLEILVIDDGSTDKSLPVIQEYCQKYPFVSLVCNEKNMGVNFTLNRGVALAKGKYIFIPGADDRVMEGHFEKTLTLLAAHPEAGLCFSDPASFDHATMKITRHNLGLSKTPAFFSPDEIVDLSRHTRLLITGGSVYKTEKMREFGGYNNDLRWHSDYFVNYAIPFRYGACYYPEPLFQWRAMPQGYMTAGVRNVEQQRTVLKLILDMLELPKHKDLKPRFIKSGALGLNPRITGVVLGNRKYWPFLNFLLLKRALPTDIFWIAPHWLQRIIRRILSGS